MKQQAINWTNIDRDLCLHRVSQGHNELTYFSESSVLPDHPSTRPRRVKSCFGRVKNTDIIYELCVLLVRNGYSDGCHEKFR